MSDFLSQLEHELIGAHPRRRAARRRATAGRALRAAPAVIVALVVLAGAGAFVLSVGGEGGSETASPPREDVPPPPVSTLGDGKPLPRGSLAILNGTTRPRLAADMSEYLRADGRVRYVGNSPRQNVARTRVHFAPGFERDVKRLAGVLDSGVAELDAATRNAARAADLVVEIGADVRAVEVAPLRSVDRGEEVGTVGVLDRAGAEDVIRLAARYSRTVHDAVWIVPRAGEEGPSVFLGRLGGPVRRKLDITTFTAAEPLGRRLVVSREPRAVGRVPSDPVLIADL